MAKGLVILETTQKGNSFNDLFLAKGLIMACFNIKRYHKMWSEVGHV